MFHSVAGRKGLGRWLVVLVLNVSACASGARGEPSIPAPRPSLDAPRPLPEAARRSPKVPPKAVAARHTRMPKPVVRIDSTALEFAVTARHAHLPLARAIARRTRNSVVAERAAWAVTREGARLKVSPSLLAAVLLIENRQLDSSAVSSQGAVGLMQVMPLHAGSYGCGSADLRTVDANICHGARILHTYIRRTRSVSLALRRYNGCVRGSNTPGCFRYPARVLRTAGRLRREMLATAAKPLASLDVTHARSE
jgi:soluble lytic murein transglycosylase-like protein